ncbi:MAG: HlyD family efflux transporter periplasmic adaptor subunit [Rhizobiales bacterium]|nr:HlyD family efflux transporter periplasmic adaptor subunit [Hyphomicrobiales bacterium]
MANPVPTLKLAPAESETAPVRTAPRRARSWLRFFLLVVVPLIAAAGGLTVYLAGGGTITTDNAYIGAQKVLITPDISGKVARVVVQEGQRVAPGAVLFEIDAAPFRLAMTQAEAQVANARTEFANLKSNLQALQRQIALAEESVSIRQNDVDRKKVLLGNRSVSAADVDNAAWNLMAAKTQLEQLLQQRASTLNALRGNPDLPVEQYPAFIQAASALEQAQRDLAHTVLRAPIAGSATQVNSIQLGRYLTAGTPVFSIIDDRNPWVDANPKETDITDLRIGQRVTIDVDTFPNRSFLGTVVAVSPGTGAQFSILPPQNASGNWVKVVQRVPVRIAFDAGEDLSRSRAGMSVTVSIATGRKRTLAGLLGLVSASAPRASP